MKKAVCFILAVLMLAGCLAGCGEKQGEEKMSISVFFWELDGVGSDPEAPVYKKLSEKFNVDFEPIAASEANWKDRLNLLFASTEVPDFFLTPGFESVQYEKWIEDGYLVPISDYASSYPNIAKQLEMFGDLKIRTKDHKHYGIPIKNGDANEAGVVNKHGMYIRSDWLKKLNLEIPKTTEDMGKVAEAFAKSDPDGNGKNDTYGLSSGGVYWLYPIVNQFNTSYYNFALMGEEYQPECLSDNMKNAVKFLHEMHLNGILDPDFSSISSDQVLEKFVIGKVGMFCYPVGVHYNKIYDKFKAVYPENDPKDMFTYVDVLEGPGGIRRIDGNDGYFGISCINADISEEKQKKIMEIADYLLSDEGRILTTYGIEGEHYKVENGKYINLIPKKEDGTIQKIQNVDATAGLGNAVCWNRTMMEDTPNRDEIEKSLESPLKYAYASPTRNFVIDDSVFSVADRKTLGDMTTQAITNMVMSPQADIDADFDNYVVEWKKTKGDIYIEEMNRVAKEAKK